MPRSNDPAKDLANEVMMLVDYINQYASRNLNITEALKKPGVDRLNKIIDLAEQVLDQDEAQPAKTQTKTAKDLLAVAEASPGWAGDDLQECLDAVENSRGRF